MLGKYKKVNILKCEKTLEQQIVELKETILELSLKIEKTEKDISDIKISKETID